MKKTMFSTILLMFTFTLSSSVFAAHHGDMKKKDGYDYMEKKDIVETAVASGNFNTLVTAIKAADLVETLKGEGPFTVFAPTDEAFKKIPEDTLNSLLADKEALAKVLTYHVVPGKIMSSEVVKLDEAKTVQGQSVKIEVKDGKVFVDGAQVISADIKTKNGVIHAIDTVIMPK